MFVQGVCKMLEQTSRVSSADEGKEKISYKHRSGNEWFLCSMTELHSTVNILLV